MSRTTRGCNSQIHYVAILEKNIIHILFMTSVLIHNRFTFYCRKTNRNRKKKTRVSALPRNHEKLCVGGTNNPNNVIMMSEENSIFARRCGVHKTETSSETRRALFIKTKRRVLNKLTSNRIKTIIATNTGVRCSSAPPVQTRRIIARW